MLLGAHVTHGHVSGAGWRSRRPHLLHVTPGNAFQPRGPVPCASATRAMRALPLSHWCPKGAESAGSGQGPVLSASCFPCPISALTCIVLPGPVLLRRLPGRPLAAKDEVAVTHLGSQGLSLRSLEATSPRPLTAVLVFSSAWLCVPTSGSPCSVRPWPQTPACQGTL